MDDKDAIIAKLTQENAYLKGLLEQHGISYEPRKEIIQRDLDDNGKIAAYISYFVGRDDIFAFEYYSKEGKRMFMPACKARPNLTGYCDGKCSECTHKQYVGVTELEIKRHLLGRDTFGIYPLLKGDLCALLAFDFDDSDFKESVLAFSAILNKHHLDHLLEISSSSGCGAHVWLFFESPILASKARRLLVSPDQLISLSRGANSDWIVKAKYLDDQQQMRYLLLGWTSDYREVEENFKKLKSYQG